MQLTSELEECVFFCLCCAGESNQWKKFTVHGVDNLRTGDTKDSQLQEKVGLEGCHNLRTDLNKFILYVVHMYLRLNVSNEVTS